MQLNSYRSKKQKTGVTLPLKYQAGGIREQDRGVVQRWQAGLLPADKQGFNNFSGCAARVL
ncbi:MAG: hypothetical protein DSY70_03285, partial [Desulfobulbus sp.]